MSSPDDSSSSITFRHPTPDDGRAMWQMARDSGALDLNSPYAYVLVGDHFSRTSLVAEMPDGHLAGFVAAYMPPTEPDVVFVWQVAVDPALRGQGVGRRLLHEVIERTRIFGVKGMTATVTPANDASRHLFQAIARDVGSPYQETPHYDADLFPGEGHEAENRIVIAPF